MVLTVVLLYLTSFAILAGLYFATDRQRQKTGGIFDDWHERRRRAASRSGPSGDDRLGA